MKEIEVLIEGVVTVDVPYQQFSDRFIAWLEENGWRFGGSIDELDEEGNIK
jgi:hypothetical protein